MTIVKIIFVTLLVLVTKANAEDCSTGICLSYQNDFGSVLIGSVNVQQGVIWGIQNSSIFTENEQFAFVGPEAYYNQLTFKPSNEWVVEGISYIHLENPEPSNTKKIGLFFAPKYVGEQTTQLIANGKIQVNLLRGIGVADNTGLIGLKVDVYRRNSTENCISSGKSGISATCTLLDYPVKISAKDNLSFVITPTIADTQQANYAKLLVAGIDIESSPDPNQKCYSSVAKDQIPLNTNKRPIGEGFVEFISQSGPSKLSTACFRYHSGFFIAEMNKSFEFQTTVTNMPTTRSVAYLFYAEGHQSSTTGNVTVKLSSSDDLKIQVAIKGNGKVTNQTYGIDCPGKCVNTKNIALNTPVTLIAEPESGYTFDGWDGDCTGTTSSLLITLDKSKSCTARFIEKPVDLDKILVIQVIGNGKVTGKVNNKDIECTSISECRETFIMSDTSTTLTATPSGTESLQWAGACSNSGTATEAKVVLNEDKVCFAIFTATDTPINQNSPLGGISARSYVGSSPSQYLYAGIKLGKTTKVMIRGLGKSLLSQGVPEALDDAKLIVRKSDGATVDSNDNWQQHTSVNELLQYQHPSDPSDAALIVTLTEGLYTVELSSTTGRAGIGLVEIYEVK